jgi:2-hydroxychromene-2-carboxylate isomerase
VITATLYSDPACPWGYSASPALHVLDWRYRDQLDWRLVVIGLTEEASQYARRGYTPVMMALGHLRTFRRYGMPFAVAPKPRISATARGCRAVVAARLADPGSEFEVYRALHFATFTEGLLLDDDEAIRRALNAAGLPGDRLVEMLDTPEVNEAYERDRAQARTAEGSPAQLQGKTATSDGPVRFTAPSVVFEHDGARLVAGGFQPVEAYDVLIANLDPNLHREPPPDTPEPLLRRFAHGLTTQEVAALLAKGNEPPNRLAAESALVELVGSGVATRTQLGDDALWRAANGNGAHRP